MAEKYFIAPKQAQEQQTQAEGWLPWLGKQIASGILTTGRQFGQAIHAPRGGLAELLQSEYPATFAVQPKTLPERFIQRTAPAVALTAATGGAFAPTLAGSTAGFAGREALDALKYLNIDVPEYIKGPVDVALDLYTTGKTTGYQQGLPTSAKSAQKLATEATIGRPLTETKGSISIAPINKQRAELKYIRSKTGGSGGKLIDEVDDIIKSALGQGKKADLAHIEYGKRRLMQKFDDLNKEGLVKSVYEPTIDKFNKILRGKEAQLVNPRFWNDLSTHDQFSFTDIKAKEIAEKAAKRFKTSAFDFFINSKYAATKLIGNLLSRGIGNTQILGKYMAQPAFRKIFIDLANATNKSDYARFAHRLGTMINKQEQSQPQEEKYFITQRSNT